MDADATPISGAQVAAVLEKYAQGLIDHGTAEGQTGLTFGEMLLRMGELGLALPIVRTYERYNAQRKECYGRIFRRQP
jgi:hypothetical protein